MRAASRKHQLSLRLTVCGAPYRSQLLMPLIMSRFLRTHRQTYQSVKRCTVGVTVNFTLALLKVTFSLELVRDDYSGWAHITHESKVSLAAFLTLCVEVDDLFKCRPPTQHHSLNLWPSSVLSIHKRPATTNSNFTFPLKGWRGMLDWVRTSEEKISVSRDALSIKQSGKSNEMSCFLVDQLLLHLMNWSLRSFFLFTDGNEAFVTGIVLYRNLASVLSFQR